jgi:hypothetical protein
MQKESVARDYLVPTPRQIAIIGAKAWRVQDMMLDVDWSSSLHMAKAIMQLQRLYGRIHVVRGVGRAATAVADNLVRLAADGATDTSMPGRALSCRSECLCFPINE